MFEAFKPMAKIPRLHGDCHVSEKIDGTNGCVEFADFGEWLGMAACSRNRRLVSILWKKDQEFDPTVKWEGKGDNYGFGAWVVKNFLTLRMLGYGRHFGEWWGQGIQRTYDLEEKRFSLFRVPKHMPEVFPTIGVGVVPQLGTCDVGELDLVLAQMRLEGSTAAPGYMNPEGIVAFHERSGALLKLTFESGPKGTTDESGHQLPEVE